MSDGLGAVDMKPLAAGVNPQNVPDVAPHLHQAALNPEIGDEPLRLIYLDVYCSRGKATHGGRATPDRGRYCASYE